MNNDSTQVLRVPETISFPEEEQKVLEYWKKIDAFRTCMKQSKGRPRFSFYDGPPFATGLPHYGHILAGTIKDVVTRYAYQQGYYVERRFGWDCHGLPVEFEIDKKLGIKGPQDVLKMGIDKYNAECRQIVTRYSKEWEIVTGRMGRWIDFKNDYKTLYPWFMESVWWVFKQLYHKGFVYQGNKVMPYSTACNTPLSNFESGQNYKDVIDPAVTVSLPLIGDKEGAALLVWTTTPWTLPSNLAACVHPELIYARFQQLSTNKIYIMLESRIETIFQADDYKILKTLPGKELKGLRYEPIFDFFRHLEDKAFVVLNDEYVTEESGTGIVHQSPYFGEDDYRVCLAAGVIMKDQEPVCPVDASGCFVAPVTEFEGQYVKDADKNIIANLKARGRLVHQTQESDKEPQRIPSPVQKPVVPKNKQNKAVTKAYEDEEGFVVTKTEHIYETSNDEDCDPNIPDPPLMNTHEETFVSNGRITEVSEARILSKLDAMDNRISQLEKENKTLKRKIETLEKDKQHIKVLCLDQQF